MLGHPSDAEDAAQEILVKVITRIGGFRRQSAFTTWVWHIATNHLLNTRQRGAEPLGLSFECFEEEIERHGEVAAAPELMNKTIVATVIHSHGCNSRHHVGDRFFFDGAGNLLTAKGPGRICIYALKAFAASVYAGNELFYANAVSLP